MSLVLYCRCSKFFGGCNEYVPHTKFDEYSYTHSTRILSTGYILPNYPTQQSYSYHMQAGTYDLNAPLATGDASPVHFTHGIRCVTVVGEPNKGKARRVTRDPHLAQTQHNNASQLK